MNQILSLNLKSKQFLFNKESDIVLNNQIHVKDEKIKELEQMQKILMETVQIKTNEIEILKQSETSLKDKNNELNSIIEINSNNHKDLSNEITSLKENLLEAQKTIETKTNEIINDLKIQIDNSESMIINESNDGINQIIIF